MSIPPAKGVGTPPPSKVGTPPPGQLRMGGTIQGHPRPWPGQDRGRGYPKVFVTPPPAALATRRALCLLRSRRRTFLYQVLFRRNPVHYLWVLKWLISVSNSEINFISRKRRGFIRCVKHWSYRQGELRKP